jgi:hypothetical protein
VETSPPPSPADVTEVDCDRGSGTRYGYESMLTADTLALLATEGPLQPHDMAGRRLTLPGEQWGTSQEQRLDEARVSPTCRNCGRLI